MNYDVDKINALRKQIYAIRKKLGLEYDPNKRKSYQYQIRVYELRIMIEKLK